MAKKRTLVSWGNEKNGRMIGCDMADVAAWMPDVNGVTRVVFKSGAVVTMHVSPGSFAEAHAVGMGYDVENAPPAQSELPATQAPVSP